MVVLEEAGYLFRIENFGKAYLLLIRREADFIKFFLRQDKTGYWVECFSIAVFNDFTEMIGTPRLDWHDNSQVLKLAIYFENACLEPEAEFLIELLNKIEEFTEV